MSDITLDLFRYDEATDDEPRRERVHIDFNENATVLDALEYAKAEVDGSISFRRSCRSAICGSCSMNINGVTGLACKTPISTVLRADRSVKIDPMPNFQPMRDMVVHMDPFWDKYSRLKPYLQPADRDEDHERERRVSPEDMKKLVAVANCVMCATCYALCPVVSVDPSFSGPAAISYAYRFIEDTRDSKRNERADQRRLFVALRALLRVFVLPQARRSARSHHRHETHLDRSRTHGRAGSPARPYGREDH